MTASQRHDLCGACRVLVELSCASVRQAGRAVYSACIYWTGRSMHLHVVVYNEDMTCWWMVTLCARVGVVFHSSSPNCLALSSASCVLSNTSVRLSVVSRNSLGCVISTADLYICLSCLAVGPPVSLALVY